MLPTNDAFREKGTCKLKKKGWKKIFLANGNDNKLEVAILIADKIDFKTKVIKINKERHYMRRKKKIWIHTEFVD